MRAKKARDRIENIPVPDMESGDRPRNTPAQLFMQASVDNKKKKITSSKVDCWGPPLAPKEIAYLFQRGQKQGKRNYKVNNKNNKQYQRKGLDKLYLFHFIYRNDIKFHIS